MDGDEIEEVRRRKMGAVRDAESAYRETLSTEPITGRDAPVMDPTRVGQLQDAVNAAREDLKGFNEDFPRFDP